MEWFGKLDNTERLQVLSGSALKVLAMVSMAIDHTASYVLRYTDAAWEPLFVLGHHNITYYFLMRCVGRLAFPIFAFLIVEGFLHTRNRRKYGRNLLLFALISEIPWNLTHGGHIYGLSQNVFFTLFLGFLALCVVERWERRMPDDNFAPRRMAIQLFAIIVAGILIRCDYGSSGVSFILLLYVLRHQAILRAAIGCCFLGSRWIAGLSFIPIGMYNGKRGFINRAWSKYLFYAFYPLHLLLLYYIQQVVRGNCPL